MLGYGRSTSDAVVMHSGDGLSGSITQGGLAVTLGSSCCVCNHR